MKLLENLRRAYRDSAPPEALSDDRVTIVSGAFALLLAGPLLARFQNTSDVLPSLGITLILFTVVIPGIEFLHTRTGGMRIAAGVVAMVAWISLGQKPMPVPALFEAAAAALLIDQFVRARRLASRVPDELEASIARNEALLEEADRSVDAATCAKREAEMRSSALAAIYEIARRLQLVTAHDELLALLSDALRDEFQIPAATVRLNPTEDRAACEQVFGLRPANLAAGVALDGAERVLLDAAGRPVATSGAAGPHGIRSVFLPLVHGPERLGGLLAERTEDWSEFDLERLRILATQFSIALKRADLFARVQALTLYDGLTGLLVVKYFREQLDREVVRARAAGDTLSVIMADVDHFKRFNDLHGHLIGDEVLRAVAATIRDSVREIDVAARYGGEEFAVMLPQTALEGAAVVAERIRTRLESTRVRHGDKEFKVTISIGVAEMPAGGESPPEAEAIIKSADAALYRAKEAGRNRVERG